MSWYYIEGDNQKGPFEEADFNTLLANGTINDNTYVFREGMSGWQPYGQVKPNAGAPPAAAVRVAVAPAPAGGVTCAECGKVFSPSDVIRHGNAYICANCKPIFLQKIKEGIQPQGALNYAGFAVRGGSLILDRIITLAVLIPLGMLLRSRLGAGGMAPVIQNVVTIGLEASYYTFFLGKYGATPGKMANKLRVVNADGTKISYLKAFGRYFASNYISGCLTLCVGYLMANWDGEKRALHDRICGTRVIRK